MMELLLRAAAFVIGLSLVLIFLQSVLRVAVVNRQRGDRLALVVGHLAYTLVARAAARRHAYDRIQDALAWVLPLYQFAEKPLSVRVLDRFAGLGDR